ncbi:5-methylcytosine-specific restriction related enzyme [Desulfosporosinus sp. I2]|uniref:McrB family protein n=1 Tax=Desulfosporosinus sp. I2 TaxID=1617025 RepID=UPI00061E3FC1|nr:DUF3578 domain-containing protein [Desulfosporosinus sp. I2]KJR49012.1 5-methylcytosine-specific restriction related enzyme [Desulfosporosinus sp. I2]
MHATDKILGSVPEVSLREHLLKVMNSYLMAKNEPFIGHELGILMRKTIPEDLQRLPFIGDRYRVEGSVGMRNWTNIPWIAVMERQRSEKTEPEEYVRYLFSENMESVYLTIQLGITEPLQEKERNCGNEDSRIQALKNMLSREPRYDRHNLPDNEVLIEDLCQAMKSYQQYVDRGLTKESPEPEPLEADNQRDGEEPEIIVSPKIQIEAIKRYIRSRGFSYPAESIENVFLALKTKPYVILAGISGTGKTKLVKLFAEASGATEQNGQYCLIPVRPDWTDPSDLLGYTDLAGNFRPTKFSRLLARASQTENRDKPYFVCLDEMNLARVEHYFSDLLSIMETRHWKEDRIETDSLLSLNDQEVLLQEEYQKLRFPDNVYLVGTVNMDETTHPFSKKVLDRAQLIEFSQIDLGRFPESRSEEDGDKGSAGLESGPISNSFFRSDYLTLQDAHLENDVLIRRSTGRLIEVNQILEGIYAQVGFRVRDEVNFYLLYNDRYKLMTEEQAFDLQLLQKILPRLQGSSSSVKKALIQLLFFALGESKNLEEMMEDASGLYLPWQGNGTYLRAKFPWSCRKLAYMLRRLEEDGFTSFWLS